MKSSVQDIKSDLENGEGLYEPIIVAYDPNNGYAIVAEGNHRVEAAIQAGQEFVPVVVVTGNVSTNKNGEATPGLVEKIPGSRFDAEMTREVNPYFIFPDSDILGESGSQDVDLDQDVPKKAGVLLPEKTPREVYVGTELDRPSRFNEKFEEMAASDKEFGEFLTEFKKKYPEVANSIVDLAVDPNSTQEDIDQAAADAKSLIDAFKKTDYQGFPAMGMFDYFATEFDILTPEANKKRAERARGKAKHSESGGPDAEYSNTYNRNLVDYKSDGKSMIQYVRTDALVGAEGNEIREQSTVDRIVKDLEDGIGFKEPLIVVVDFESGKAFVTEGNHRLAAARRAGIDYVPIRILDVQESGGNAVKLERVGKYVSTTEQLEKLKDKDLEAILPSDIFPESDLLSDVPDVDLDQDVSTLERVPASYALDDFVQDPDYGDLDILSPDGAIRVSLSRSTYREDINIEIEDADNERIASFSVSENSDDKDLINYIEDVLSEEGISLAAGQEFDKWLTKDRYFAPEGEDAPSAEDSKLESVMRRYADSSAVNLWLRGSINETPVMAKDVANLDNAIESYGEFFEGRVYRGVLMDTSEWDSQNLQFGQIITDPGYMSTSKDFNVAERFSRGGSESNRSISSGKTRVVYLIDLDGRSKSLDLDGKFKYPEEREVLLKRGMSFRVTGIEEVANSNQKFVTIREIPSQSSPDLDQGLPGIAESDNDLSASSLQRRSNEIFDRLKADLLFTPRADPVSVKKSEIPAIAARDVESNKSVVASVLQEVKDAFKSPASWIKNFTNRDRQTPVHPLSKQEYKAFNLVALSAAADKAGYSDPRWLTKAEAEKSYGAKLNPDATPTMIAVPVLHSYEDENGNKFETVRFTPAEVYNAEQFSGMPAYEAPETVEYTPQEAFEVILDRFNRAEIERKRRGAPSILGMKIDDTSVNPDTGRPIRSPNYSKDRVKLPLRSQFKSDEAWIQSLAHELIHSTGASFRQNRSETQEAKTDSTQRAREEAIAEMASAMLMKMFGLNYDTKNSAAYVKTQALKGGLSDEDLTDAAIKAQAAIDYMLGNDLDTIPKWDPTTTKRPQTPTEFRNTELTPLQSSINPDTSQASIEALSLPEVSLDQDVSSSDKAKQKVYDALIEKLTKLGNSITPWRKPFKDGFEFTGGSGIPRNPSSKRLYSGFNSFWLKIAAMSEDYTDSRWMTYKQAQALGGQVRLGEKGVPILVPVKFMVTKDKEGKPLLDRNGKETGFSKLYFKAATVFNVAQIDGLNLPDDKPSTEMTPVEAQDFIIDRYGKSMKAKGLTAPVVDYSYVGDYSDHASSPNWSPFDDRITLPGLAQFNSPEEIFDTIMHELTHSTGHRRRLDRSDLLRDYGNPNGQARAQEELIAEMGAAILGEMFGVNYDVDNTQAYMQSWFSVLKDGNPELLQIAASKAQQAVDYMLGMDLGDWSPLDGYNTYLGKQGQEGDEE